jgi:DNA-binding LacI/PurR family transcriptional regulator
MNEQRTKRATLYDVAKNSGVSYQTVSRVINNSPNVSNETRRRVLEVIESLGYQPNRTAQALATRRSYAIQLIVVGLGQYFPDQIVSNVENIARSFGYKLIVTNIQDTPEAIRQITDYLNVVDGVIMITPLHYKNYALLEEACKDVLTIQTLIDVGSQSPSVVIDQRHGSRLATQHLIDLGHQHIAEVSGPLNYFDAVARHESWLATLAANKLEPVAHVQAEWSAAGGYRAAHELVDQGKPFTGVVVGCDQIAIGVMRALRERGFRIPEDVSVVGFDDLPEAAYLEPPLTTVRQDATALSRHCVEYLLQLISNPETPVHQRVLYPTSKPIKEPSIYG